MKEHRRASRSQSLAEAFTLIEAAAIANERCPQNRGNDGPLKTGITGDLARAGLVRFEVYRHNYRVATILKGSHAGKHTLRPAALNGMKPHRIGDTSGFYRPFDRL